MGGVATEPQARAGPGQRTRNGLLGSKCCSRIGRPRSGDEDGATHSPNCCSLFHEEISSRLLGERGGDSFWRVCPFPTALMLDNERSVNAVTFESNRSATKRGRRAVAGAFWRQTSGPPTLGNANRRGMEVSQLTVSVEVGWNAVPARHSDVFAADRPIAGAGPSHPPEKLEC